MLISKRSNKKGQEVFSMSFGMIFSIILIIVIIAVAFYAIRFFLNLNKCTDASFFFDELQKEVDRAWSSGSYKSEYNGRLPSGTTKSQKITQVCFGSLTLPNPTDSNTKSIKDYFSHSSYNKPKNNIFLYPPENSCGGKLASYSLEHVAIPTFFCLNVDKDRVSIPLNKGTSDASVKVG
ncbi:MAG: hypothetical protein Q7S74_01020 [Nanoarchaeota archaeon]|nr:hypothetical protein [Nanoarchaeota archaeon]